MRDCMTCSIFLFIYQLIMKNILKMFSFEKLKNNVRDVIIRFPISFIFIVINSLLFVVLINFDPSNVIEDYVIRSIFSIIVIFFLSVWVYLFSESVWHSKLKTNISQLFVIFFWILFFINFDQDIDYFENFVFFLLTLIWILTFLFFAPYLKIMLTQKYKENVFYSYFYNIASIFLISLIFWWVLFALWAIWIAATFELFDLSSSNLDELIGDWAVLSLSLSTPLFALTQIPLKKDFESLDFKENTFFSFLIKYIATPFIYVYFLILYAYSIKVLSNFSDWPKWEVSWLVIWFSSFGYLIYIFSYVFQEENRFIKTFRKAFPYVVIPQIFMLFYAIYLRINQYDLTINRYFVVVFGIRLLTISIYNIFSKQKKLSFIVSVLTLFTIIISIWPWSVYFLPETRQYNLLIKDLKEANILQDWKIVPLSSYEDIDKVLSKNIYSKIYYLCSYSNCELIKNLFSEIVSELEEENKENYKWDNWDNDKYYRLNRWNIVEAVTNKIKVQNYFIEKNSNPLVYLYINNNETVFPLDVSWYNKIYNINSYDNSPTYAKLNNNKIDIIELWEVVYSIDISAFIEKLQNEYKDTNNIWINKDNLSFEIEWFKIYFTNISIQNPYYTWKSNNYKNNANWYLLIK